MVAVLAIAGSWLVGAGSEDRVAAAEPPAPMPRLPATLEAQVVSVPSSLPDSTLRAVPAAAPPADADTAEVCGIGSVTRAEAEESRPSAHAMQMKQAAAAALQQVAEALASDRSEEARSLGDWLMAGGPERAASEQIPLRLSACAGSPECENVVRQEAGRAAQEAAQPFIDRMVERALSSRNPVLTAIALQACRVRTGRCTMLGVERWTQLDPDNAMPWLFLAQQASARQDEAARIDALFHASVAKTSKLYGDSLLAVAEAALQPTPASPAAPTAVIDIVGIQAAWSFPSLRTITESCTAAQLNDANRRQLCDSIATVLLDKGRTWIERGFAIRLGERLGWPEDRLAALRLERDAWSALQAKDFVEGQGNDVMSCGSLQQLLAKQVRLGKLGEVQSARADLLASGKPLAELAAQTVASREAAQLAEAQRRAAEDASAVSPAASVPRGT